MSEQREPWDDEDGTRTYQVIIDEVHALRGQVAALEAERERLREALVIARSWMHPFDVHSRGKLDEHVAMVDAALAPATGGVTRRKKCPAPTPGRARWRGWKKEGWK